MVRFKYHVPRWAIIQCLSILGRLSTKDRMQSLGLAVDRSSVLCASDSENHGNFFFQCGYYA